MGLLDLLRSAKGSSSAKDDQRLAHSKQRALELIDSGNVLERENRLDEALRCYEDALSLAPDLPRAHLSRGNILLARNDVRAAAAEYSAAIHLDPKYSAAHYNLGNASVQLGDYDTAQAAYETAIESKPDFADAHLALGCLMEDLGRVEPAIDRYRQAVELNPDYPQARFNLGNALAGQGRLDEAATHLEQAAILDQGFAQAHFALGRALLQLGRQDEARERLKRAIEVESRVDAFAVMGAALRDMCQLDLAIDCFRRVLEVRPESSEGHSNLAVVLREAGQPSAAIESCRRALQLDATRVEAYINLGLAQSDLRLFEDAVATYRLALQVAPRSPEVHSDLGLALAGLKQYDAALASFQRAVDIGPPTAEILNNFGATRRQSGDLDGAVSCFRRAVAMSPDFAEGHSNLGVALIELGDTEGALSSCRRALDLRPDFAEAHNNLGNVFARLGRMDQAVASYRKAVEINPEHAQAHSNLAAAFRRLGQLDAAEVSCRRAVQIAPDFAEARGNLASILTDSGRLDEALGEYRRVIRLDPDAAWNYSNLLFCLAHVEDVSADALVAEHRGFAERFELPLRDGWPNHQCDRDPERRLKVGFVSGDFRRHAVASFIEPILEELRKSSRLSLYAYHNHVADDDVTDRLRRMFGKWRRVAGLSDQQLAEAIRADGIDILIDLSGHTGENRLATFARKPAPVQASWIGYPGTTGLSAMDYYLADRYFLPIGQFDNQFTERIVYLPAVAAFMPGDESPPVNTLPATVNGHVTFGSFNRLSKIGATTVSLWSQLLRALPDSRLLIGGMPSDCKVGTLLERFEREGIARARLDIYPRTDSQAYLKLHHSVDLCVDTFPYTGGTTVNHALWMGVPTLTLVGDRPQTRHGATLLGHLGLDGFMADNIAEYLRLGMHWATSILELADVRSGLRQQYRRSVICQPERVAAGFETALRMMWQRWCAGQSASSFEVPSAEMDSYSEHST